MRQKLRRRRGQRWRWDCRRSDWKRIYVENRWVFETKSCARKKTWAAGVAAAAEEAVAGDRESGEVRTDGMRAGEVVKSDGEIDAPIGTQSLFEKW